jgi:cephalosporin hydroxylase
MLVIVASLGAGVLLGRYLQSRIPPDGQTLAAKCPDAYVVDRFQQIWYDAKVPWNHNRWMGIQAAQNPMDAWMIQEIIFDTRPDFIVECGAFHGGSAAAWATFLREANPAGRVISVDIEDRMQKARELPVVKERVVFLVGSSTAPEIVKQVRERVGDKRAMVILDSLHTQAHVLKELQLYSPLVQVGDYLIVQDTNVNGHPVHPGFGPGPQEAVQAFLAATDAFEPDRGRERLVLTFSPNGYLRRVK